jgi:hypothetical protein
MFCCRCGARNPNDAIYCNKCGNLASEQEANGLLWTDENSKRPRSSGGSKSQLLSESVVRDQKPSQCHGCGRADQLYTWDFGLGKEISTRRAWEETAASVAISAITVPLLGVGMLRLPGKKTRFQVLRLQLILCEKCRDSRMTTYLAHPLWEPAHKLGFTEFMNANELATLRPAPSKK